MKLSLKINEKLLNMLDLFTEPNDIADFVETLPLLLLIFLCAFQLLISLRILQILDCNSTVIILILPN